jgi:RimJ/RimL family protein N-acetyltransferase
MPAPINTSRLFIKSLERSDAAGLFAYRSDERVARYQTFRPTAPEDAAAFIDGNSGPFGIEGTWHQLGIHLGGQLIGDIGIHFLGPGNLQCEIGYTVSPACQGKGYAKEAVRAVLGFLFDGLGKHRVVASVDLRNAASVALLERLGFRKEGHFVKSVLVDGAWEDAVQYGLLDEEWRIRQNGGLKV